MMHIEDDEILPRGEHCVVRRRSGLTGNTAHMEIPMSREELLHRVRVYNTGALLQQAFDNLEADLREFLLTGITPTEWKEEFSDV